MSTDDPKAARGASESKDDTKPPRIVDHLKSQFVEDGKSVVLSCRIIGQYFVPKFIGEN